METVLERAKIPVVPVPKHTSPLKETIGRAQSILGYAYSELAVNRSFIPALCLAETNIQPFTNASVRKYQRHKVTRALALDLLPPTILFGISLLALWASIFKLPHEWYGVVAIVISGLASGGSVLLAIGMAATCQRWIYESLASYRQPVPVEVIERALALEDSYIRKCRAHGLSVEEREPTWRGEPSRFQIGYLAYPKMEPVRADPFLVWNCNGQRFFIDAWDEPGFDQQRVI